MNGPDPDKPDWQWGTYEGAELNSLLRGLRRSFREKVIWLEEAETLTLALRAAREKAAREPGAVIPGASEPPAGPNT